MSDNGPESVEELIGALMSRVMDGPVAPEEMEYEDLKLGIDEGLVVTIESVEGTAFEESHSHIVPEEDMAILHLVPPESQAFHETTKQFSEDNL